MILGQLTMGARQAKNAPLPTHHLHHLIIFAAVIITIIIITRKMITADINAIIFITGNFTVIINCVGIGLRTLFGPLPYQVVVIIIVIFTTTIPTQGS